MQCLNQKSNETWHYCNDIHNEQLKGKLSVYVMTINLHFINYFDIYTVNSPICSK